MAGQQSELALASVKARCAELEAPFPNLASAFMVEEALYTLARSYYSDHFVLRNASELNLSTYRRRVVHTLSFYYNGSFAVRDLAIVLTRSLIREKETEIDWEMGLRMASGTSARVLMKGDLAGMSVPFEILLTAAEETLPSRSEELRLFFYPDRHFPCLVYPKENLLLDAIVEILVKLELAHDLSPYDRVYQMLKTETIDGRHIRDGLFEALFAEKLNLDPKRLNLLLNYRSYAYMKKKWRSYLRGAKKNSPAWEDVIDLLGQFLTPIWDALCKDEIFFGDWMPDLGRFI